MTTPQRFGDYPTDLIPSQEYLIISFSPSSIPLQQRWRNNGLSANFIADYLTSFFPSEEGAMSEIDRQAEVQSAVSFITNELLENAMKFNDEASPHPISICLYLYEDRVLFQVTNSIAPQAVEPFQRHLQKLIGSDPGELYLQHLEGRAETEGTSGLGFLTIINDYPTKLGWEFAPAPNHPQVMTVKTSVQLTV